MKIKGFVMKTEKVTSKVGIPAILLRDCSFLLNRTQVTTIDD